MDKLLLSIVIPTKNRYKYLIGSLESLRLLKGKEFEVVVQDNSDENRYILDYLDKQSDIDFVKYYYCRDHLSMSENSDLAISHASGEYICFLGDDDTVSNKIFDVIDYLEKNHCDSCLGTINRFNWEDYREIHPGADSYKSYRYREEYKIVNTEGILCEVMKKGATDMLNLPRVYHGVVKKSLLETIKNATGTYFPGPSPDMASAVAIAIFAKRHIETDIPFIISGFSFNSGGGQGNGGHHGGEIRKVGYLPNNIMEIWDERIPAFFSGLTIWPVTFIQALKMCGKEDLCSYINYNYIYANLYISHMGLMKKTKCNSVHLVNVLPLIVKSFVQRGFAFVIRRVSPKLIDNAIIVNDVNTLKDALLFELNNKKNL